MGRAGCALLLADVLGSARLYGSVDAATAQAVEARCRETMRQAAQLFGGTVRAAVGDELLASFEQADDAWRAAREIQVKLGEMPPVAPGFRLSSRLGLHLAAGAQPADDELAVVARAAGHAVAGQVLATAPFIAALGESVRPPVGAARTIGFRAASSEAFPLEWRPPTVRAAAAAPLAPPAALLRLRCGEREFLLGGTAPEVLTLGRDPAVDVPIADRRASRRHGQLICRGSEVFYVDCSTNGSFVTQGGAAEVFVRGEEVRLGRSGTICFAASLNEPATECARYELLPIPRST